MSSEVPAREPGLTLVEAHGLASKVESHCREAWPELAGLIVHTEP